MSRFLYPPNLEPVGGFWPGYSSKDWFKLIYPHLHREYDYNNYDQHPDYNLTFESDDNHNKPRSSIYYREIDGVKMELKTREDVFLTDYKEMNDNKNYGNSFFKPLECMQLKGQIMYLPEFWWHSVLNLGNVVIGGAIQTSNSRTPWMFERDIHDNVREKVNAQRTELTDLELMAKRIDGIKAFERLSHYGPISAVHHFFMGFELYDMSEFREAIKHLTDAILMDPTYIEAYSYLGRIYMYDAEWNEFYDPKKAYKLLRIAYMLNPYNENLRTEFLRVLKTLNLNHLMAYVANRQPLPSA